MLLCPIIFCVLFFSPFHIPKANAHFFSDFSIADEKKLAKEFEVLVKSKLPIIEDPVIKIYINDLMNTLLEGAPPQPFDYQANVVYSHALNAFASPGGFIVIFTGLIAELENEAQLAGIMAHEIAHVTQRHIAKNIDKNKFMSIGSILGMLAGALAGGDTAAAVITTTMAVNQAAQLNYSRSDENDADKFGLQYLLKANFDPNGLVQAFQILENNSLGVGSTFPTYLSTHPAIHSRIANIKSSISSLPPTKYRPLSSQEFLRVKALCLSYYADDRKASIYFNDLLRQAPKNSLAYLGLGIIASKKNNFSEAEKQFDEAIYLQKNDFLIQREVGRFNFERGNFQKALPYLEEAIRLNPKDYMAIFFKARLLNAQKKYPEAHKAFEQVLLYAPEDVELYTMYGRSLGQSGKEFEGYLALAYAEIYSNNIAKARSWIKRAQKLAVTNEDKERIKKTEAILATRQKHMKKK